MFNNMLLTAGVFERFFDRVIKEFRASNSSSGGLSPGHDTCVLEQDTLLLIASLHPMRCITTNYCCYYYYYYNYYL